MIGPGFFKSHCACSLLSGLGIFPGLSGVLGAVADAAAQLLQEKDTDKDVCPSLAASYWTEKTRDVRVTHMETHACASPLSSVANACSARSPASHVDFPSTSLRNNRSFTFGIVPVGPDSECVASRTLKHQLDSEVFIRRGLQQLDCHWADHDSESESE